jgi:hypothetical protein
MGLFWDLIQQGQLHEQSQRTGSMEERIRDLEADLERTNRTLLDLMRVLEQKFGEDLDRDGRIG